MPNRNYRDRAVANHLRRLEPKELETRYTNRGEPEVVPGFQLSAVLKRWEAEFLADRPRNEQVRKGSRTTGMQFIGPHMYLAEQTGIHERRVHGFMKGEFPFVNLSQADALLQAIERPDILGDEVQIVPNPNWSMENWIEYMRERGCYGD